MYYHFCVLYWYHARLYTYICIYLYPYQLSLECVRELPVKIQISKTVYVYNLSMYVYVPICTFQMKLLGSIFNSWHFFTFIGLHYAKKKFFLLALRHYICIHIIHNFFFTLLYFISSPLRGQFNLLLPVLST